MDLYDYGVRAQDGRQVSLLEYKGKVLLIVNTATGCGFTPQYNDLQELYELHQKGRPGDSLFFLINTRQATVMVI